MKYLFLIFISCTLAACSHNSTKTDIPEKRSPSATDFVSGKQFLNGKWKPVVSRCAMSAKVLSNKNLKDYTLTIETRAGSDVGSYVRTEVYSNGAKRTSQTTTGTLGLSIGFFDQEGSGAFDGVIKPNWTTEENHDSYPPNLSLNEGNLLMAGHDPYSLGITEVKLDFSKNEKGEDRMLLTFQRHDRVSSLLCPNDIRQVVFERK